MCNKVRFNYILFIDIIIIFCIFSNGTIFALLYTRVSYRRLRLEFWRGAKRIRCRYVNPLKGVSLCEGGCDFIE